MTRSWRVCLAFAGVFLAGAVAGGFVALRIAEASTARRGPDDLALRIMKRFSERLELTDDQRQVIRPHVEHVAAELHRMRAETAELMQQLEEIVARELTPAQRETLEVMQAEHRERWRRWMERRREHEQRDGGRGPPRRGKDAPRVQPPA